MFCTQCGHKQLDSAGRFCSRCGYQLDGAAASVPSRSACGGLLSPVIHQRRRLSARQLGIRRGAMMMLGTILVVPLMAILGVVMLHFPVEFVPASAIICFVGGFLRIIYALLMQEETAAALQPAAPYVPAFVPAKMSARSGSAPLNASPASPSFGKWRDPDLYQPASVTENTTNLLRFNS